MAAIGVAVFSEGGDRFIAGAVFAAVAVITWLLGWACRYVLSGE